MSVLQVHTASEASIHANTTHAVVWFTPWSKSTLPSFGCPIQPCSVQDFRPTAMDPPQPIPPELIEFAGRMYDAARRGDLATFRQALPSGLPPNLTNEKGDTLVS